MAPGRGLHSAASILARPFAPQVTSLPSAAFRAYHSLQAKRLSLSGCITALATPFDGRGDLDLDAWRALLDRQVRGGIQGVVVAGSTGEAAALSDEEYVALISAAVAHLAGAMPVLAGTGQMNTAKTIAQTRLAASAGADYALVVTPPYVRAPQAGLEAHYRAVAEQGGLPVVLYNVPGRTGCDLLPTTVAALAAHPRIVGIKESRTEPDRRQALLALRRRDFCVLSGDDGTAGQALLAGADGLISVGANALPSAYRHLCELARRGEASATQSWDAQLAEFHAFFGIESNPIPVKALLQRQGVGQGLRLPLLPLSETHAGLADRLAERAIALEAQSSREPLAA